VGKMAGQKGKIPLWGMAINMMLGGVYSDLAFCWLQYKERSESIHMSTECELPKIEMYV
jgi:hypothetical protein